jgi:hypothetical protein
MESATYWVNEWSAINQAPHLVGNGIVVIVVVIAKLTLSLSRWLYSSEIDDVKGQLKDAHEQIQSMTEAERRRERDWPGSAIQYHGEAGISRACQVAVMRLLQSRETLLRARIVSFFDTEHPSHHDPEEFEGDHGILFTIGEFDELIAIKQGFASGYYGEGPRTFAFVLALLEAHKIPIEEYEVDKGFIDRLNKCALTNEDIKKLDSTDRRWPVRWYGYVHDAYGSFCESAKHGTLWRQFPEIIPFCIIDSRIMDLAISFWDDPDDSLLKGYRRLEDLVRERCGLSDHGANLFTNVFHDKFPKLRWAKLGDVKERAARVKLFEGAYGAHRNPRGHREFGGSLQELTEFMLLNHLYLLERESEKVELNEGILTFRDIVGRMRVLRITCDKCGRHSEDELNRLVERYGVFGKIDEWSRIATFDCPRRRGKNDDDPCGPIRPDLPNVV